MKKRILSILLTLCLLVSMVSGVAAAASIEDFTDVSEGAWYYQWAEDVVDEGYFIGTSDTTFSPNAAMSRAMMVTVLYRMSGEQVSAAAKAGFDDVSDNAWYAGPVAWGVEKGILFGMGNNKFAPNEPITREQMAAIIDRFLTYMAKKCGVSYDHLQTHEAVEFADGHKILAYAVDSVKVCQKYGLIEGFPAAEGESANTFRPRDTFLRQHGVKIISMLADILENGKSSGGSSGGSTGGYPGSTTYTYTINYHVTTDGVTWSLWEGKSTVETSTTNATLDLTITSETPGSYTVNGVEYAFVGWGTTLNNATGGEQLEAGDTVSVNANDSETLYAIYIPVGDYIYKAMEAAVADMQALAKTLNGLNVDVDGSNVSADDFAASVTVGGLSVGTEAHSVNVTVAGELGMDIIDRVLETATTYAVAILGNEPMPTVDELTGLVKDTAGELGITITEVNARAIAESVYNKLQDKGADVFANFRNYEGGFCVDEISMENGKLVLSVNNAEGIVGSGSTAQNLKKVQALTVAVARELYASLNTAGGSKVENGRNVATLKSTVSVVFSPAAALEDYYTTNNITKTYDINLTVCLTSDMFAYSWDGQQGTLTMTLGETIQTGYAQSVDELVAAALDNGTIGNKLTGKVQSALSGNSMFNALKSVLGDEAVNTAVNTAIAQWVDDLSAENGSVVLDNAALYELTTSLCEDVAVSVAEIAAAEAEKNELWPYLTDDMTKMNVIKAGIESELDKHSAIAGNNDLRYYLLNLCLAESAALLNIDNSAWVAAADKTAVRSMIDTMISDAMANTTVAGKTLDEYLELLEQAQTLKGLQTVALSNVGTVLENAAFQSLAAKYGNAYVEYVASAISRLPASAAVEVNGVALNQAALADVQAAAAGGDAAGVCGALAALFQDTALSGLSMKSFEDGELITVRYGQRTFDFIFMVQIP